MAPGNALKILKFHQILKFQKGKNVHSQKMVQQKKGLVLMIFFSLHNYNKVSIPHKK